MKNITMGILQLYLLLLLIKFPCNVDKKTTETDCYHSKGEHVLWSPSKSDTRLWKANSWQKYHWISSLKKEDKKKKGWCNLNLDSDSTFRSHTQKNPNPFLPGSCMDKAGCCSRQHQALFSLSVLFLAYFVWLHIVPEDFISQGLEPLLQAVKYTLKARIYTCGYINASLIIVSQWSILSCLQFL